MVPFQRLKVSHVSMPTSAELHVGSLMASWRSVTFQPFAKSAWSPNPEVSPCDV